MPSDSRKQAQKYVKELLKAGLRNSDIQHAAGIHYETVRRILEGTTKTDRVSGRVFTALKALHEKHVVRGEPVRQQESDSEDESALDFNAPAEVVYNELADRYALPLWNELTAKRQNLLRAEFAAAGYAIESAKFRFIAATLAE